MSAVTAFSPAVETILTEMYLHVEVPFTDILKTLLDPKIAISDMLDISILTFRGNLDSTG